MEKIMKISILTQPIGHNYGGLLQAYALQKFLKEQGCYVETIDRGSPKRLHRKILRQSLNFILLIFGRIKEIPTEKKQKFVFKNLIKFRNENIVLSERICSEKKLRDYYRKNCFDAVIVGSDQVWRPKYSSSLRNFYLNFLDDIGSSAKRVSYAASFGVDVWEYNPKETQTCKALIHKFDAISVREKSAQDLCLKYFGLSPEWVLDPTMLFGADHYRKFFNHKKSVENKGKLLTYILDTNSEKEKIIKSIAKCLSVDSFSINPVKSDSEVGADPLHKYKYLEVEDWLQSFDDASFVVTDSFHGCVFSIIFSKPFIAIGNMQRGLSRFQSLLSSFNLESRLIFSTKDVDKRLTEEKIDWEKVNSIVCVKAEMSRKFLVSNLGIPFDSDTNN